MSHRMIHRPGCACSVVDPLCVEDAVARGAVQLTCTRCGYVASTQSGEALREEVARARKLIRGAAESFRRISKMTDPIDGCRPR